MAYRTAWLRFRSLSTQYLSSSANNDRSTSTTIDSESRSGPSVVFWVSTRENIAMPYDDHPELAPPPFGSGDSTPIEQTARFDHVLRFIEAKGGRYQRGRKEFAAELDVSEYCLRRVIERGTALGLLKLTASAHPMVGQGGRFPTLYELLVPVDEWLANRERIIAACQESGRRAKRARQARTRTARKKAQVAVAVEAAAIRPQAIARRAATAPPIPFTAPVMHGTVDDLDVDAWYGAVDFDDVD